MSLDTSMSHFTCLEGVWQPLTPVVRWYMGRSRTGLERRASHSVLSQLGAQERVQDERPTIKPDETAKCQLSQKISVKLYYSVTEYLQVQGRRELSSTVVAKRCYFGPTVAVIIRTQPPWTSKPPKGPSISIVQTETQNEDTRPLLFMLCLYMDLREKCNHHVAPLCSQLPRG